MIRSGCPLTMPQPDNQKPKSDIDELRESLKQSLLERVSSPLIGSFAISWVIVNWRGIAYFMLSEDTIVERLAYIETHFSSHRTLWAIPLLVALLYVFGYPWPNRQIVRYRSLMNRRDEEIRLKDEDKLRLAIQKRHNSEEWRKIEKEKKDLAHEREELSYARAHFEEDESHLDRDKDSFNKNKQAFLARIAQDVEYKTLISDADQKTETNPPVSNAAPKIKIDETIIGKVTATKRVRPENLEFLYNQGFTDSDLEAIFIDRKYSFNNIKKLLDKIGLEKIRWLIDNDENLSTVLQLSSMELSWEQIVKLINCGADLAQARNMLTEKMSFENIVKAYQNHESAGNPQVQPTSRD